MNDTLRQLSILALPLVLACGDASTGAASASSSAKPAASAAKSAAPTATATETAAATATAAPTDTASAAPAPDPAAVEACKKACESKPTPRERLQCNAGC